MIKNGVEQGVVGIRPDVSEAIDSDNMYASILTLAQQAKEITKSRDIQDRDRGYIKFYPHQAIGQALVDSINFKNNNVQND